MAALEVSEEWRVEHRNHLMHVDGCPYCFQRLRAGIENEPPQRVADFCLVHGTAECSEPDCYACGNHELDERGRCTARGCGASNTPEIVELLADFTSAPIELKRYLVGKHLAESLERMRGFPA